MSEMAQTQGQAAEAQAEGSLLDQVMAQTRLAPSEDGYDIAKQGVAAFIAELLRSDDAAPQVNKAVVDRMIVELDRKIGSQVDEILHDRGFQQIESAWRGLKLLVDRTDF
ncbi:MAG: type VI secretion system contractile sheath domain-containing protein, partial [Billgrantia desiderata]